MVIEDVPAEVCQQCGEKYFGPGVYKEMETLAKTKKKPIEHACCNRCVSVCGTCYGQSKEFMIGSRERTKREEDIVCIKLFCKQKPLLKNIPIVFLLEKEPVLRKPKSFKLSGLRKIGS